MTDSSADTRTMALREIGDSGVRVSSLGYGAWGIGESHWKGADDRESERALAEAIQSGVKLIDTARIYGSSERIVGSAVRRFPEAEVTIATKVAPKNRRWPAATGSDPDDAFPREHIVESVHESLRQTGLDQLGLLQFHVWTDSWLDGGSWRDAVTELKAAGKIRAFGVSLNDYDPSSGRRAVQDELVDCVQLIYNVFHQAPEDELLPLAERENVGVIVRVALDEGGLTGRIGAGTTFPPGDFRASYFGGDRLTQLDRRVDSLVRELGVQRDELPAIALRFVLSQTAVSSVVVGMRSVRNVRRNLDAVAAGPLAAEQIDILRRHVWERNFYLPAEPGS